MTRLGRILQNLQRDLARLDTVWALVGGMAVSARTDPRLTRDIEVAVAASGDAAAETVEILPDLPVPVCATAHLLVLKILARDDEARPQDQVDIKALACEMTGAAWQEALRLAALIQERGYDRQRDLVAALNELRGGLRWI